LGEQVVGVFTTLAQVQQQSTKDAQIRAHLYEGDRSFRTPRQVSRALSDVGLKASDNFIKGQLEAAGGQGNPVSATDDLIRAYLQPPGEPTRTQEEAGKALPGDGFTASNAHLGAMRKNPKIL
jgi:hypothetical protein